MARMIIGILTGFFLWSVLWVGSEPVIAAVAPSMAPGDDLSNIRTDYLVLKIVLSVLFSTASGYIAVTLAKEHRKTPLVLGVLLLLVGIAVEASVWNLLPVWYHLVFLALLIPATVIGGMIRKA